jgi:hypothetical protein
MVDHARELARVSRVCRDTNSGDTRRGNQNRGLKALQPLFASAACEDNVKELSWFCRRSRVVLFHP